MKQAFLFLILLLIFVAAPASVFAAEVAIDASIHTTLTSHNGSSPTVVFISDQVGYAFFRDSAGSCAYSKTTNGGTSWGTSVTVDAQTDCFKIAAWYDRWTPGDTTGTYIHITTIDAADVWYTRLNTSGDTLTTVVNASAANQGGGFAVGANIPYITKGTDGDLYMGAQDAGDSFVIKCSTSCDTATNWTEAGTNPFDLATDWLILMPLSSGNILAIRWDISADDVQSKVYADSTNSWDSSWTTVDANAVEDGTYDGHFGATIKKSTGDIYLAYATDVATFGTDDDIRTAVYSGGAWTVKTDVLTNDSKGITGAKISFDENMSEIYAIYTARTTAGTAASGNVYYKKSADGMASWGAEQGPVNATAGDLYGARVNAMSDERIYATWDLASADDLMGNTVADILPSDTTAPAAVSDLALSSPSNSAMTVSWTAPGDDGSTGVATIYDLRYSTSAITDGNFSSATHVSGEPTPSVAGSLESMNVTGLSASTTYYFAIKTSDEVPNTSAISNFPSGTTLATGGGPSPEPASTPSSGSGGSAPPRRVIFSGQAYPQSKIDVLRKLVEDETYIVGPSESSVINEDGSFVITVTGLIRANYLFALRVNDKDERNSGILVFSAPFYIDQPGDLFEVKDILVPPTMAFEKALVTKNDVMKIDGYASPNNMVELEVDGAKYLETKAGQSGFYNFNAGIINLAYGEHRARVRQAAIDGKTSGFSTLRIFKLSKQLTLKTDFNNDGAVSISDWSIFLFRWGSDKEESRLQNDLNGDGKADIFDLSIFLKSMNI